MRYAGRGRPGGQESARILSRRNIFILPTREGLLFAVVLFAMLLGAVNENNSLGFALIFLLGGMAIASMLHAYRNLEGVRIAGVGCSAVFAGEEARVAVTLENPSGRARRAVELSAAEPRTWVCGDLPGGGSTSMCLRVPAVRRGRLQVNRLTLSSRFPIGLFRVWTRLPVNVSCLVYPAPRGSHELPRTDGSGARTAQGGAGPGEDFAGLRAYRSGDSLRHVSWKAVARGQGFLTKQFDAGQACPTWLDWQMLGAQGRESRLSQLCRWVLVADSKDIEYGLRLPGREIQPARGTSHREQCLCVLALF